MDYLVTEAVAIKVKQEDFDAQKEAESKAKREQFKKEAVATLDQFR